MTGAAEILVVILAVVLAIFLVLAVILVVMMIRITRQIKTITGTAERTVADLQRATLNISKYATPLMAVRSIMKAFKSTDSTKKARKR